MLDILSKFPDWYADLVELVRMRTRYAVMTTIMIMCILFGAALLTQGENIGKLIDYGTGAQERAAAEALAVIDEQDRQNDVMISAMLRRLMRDLNAGRVVVKIVMFDPMTGEFSDLAESHEIMDRRAERTGLRSRTLSRNDVQQTLDTMFPENGRVVCMTSPVEEVPDADLQLFLRAGDFNWTSACPIIDPDGSPMGLLAVSGRTQLADSAIITERVRDSAFLLSGYLLRSPAAEQARRRLENM